MKMLDFSKYEMKIFPAEPLRPLSQSPKLMEDYNRKLIIFNTEKDAYYQEKDALMSQAKHDILEDVGLLGHPKAEIAWDIAMRTAWTIHCDCDEGTYPFSLCQVHSYLQDLVELVF
jgi:hypothetical protein